MGAVWEPRLQEFVKLITARRESAALELIPDLMPTLDVLADDPEYAFLRGERYCTGDAQRTAVAGQYAYVGIRNPAGSNALLVVSGISVYAGTAATVVRMQLEADAAFAVAATATSTRDTRDARWTPGSNLNCIGVVGADANATAAVRFIRSWTVGLASWTVLDMGGDIVVSPGYRLVWKDNTVNQLLVGAVTWEERVVQPDELVRR